MINEKAATSLELTDPIGKQIKNGETIYTIAGVLKNVNTKTLHLQVDPQVYTQLDKIERYHPIMVKTNNQVESAIKTLSAVWTKTNPDIPFEYFFLDDAYGKLYKTEDTASKIISAGMVIALFLAFMGLYAISHYATERRIKEIGLRKVNGARISEVLLLLNRDFIRWILISVAIATPVTWYVLHKWLSNFAYKTTLSWWVFALSGLAALTIAVLTVSWQSWRAATRNPVEALRYE
jgi:putative ABC transport system permease protein